ncbi:hypothetical protein RN001_003972 [Aquatica leii]|uniref:Uncharacterized protein n=1 Tax=Aquatica leii TaxID=1421715 RepID=A0AAN7SEE1_9COLE|nr:hypothetical protein RN001_003972 [Aquatica leii]
MRGVFISPLFFVLVGVVLSLHLPCFFAKEKLPNFDVTKLAKLEQGTELVVIESGYNDKKSYRLEDFFWTGSGDGGVDENDHDESTKSTTVYRTKTVLSTVYISTPTTYFNKAISSHTETTTSCPFNCDTTVTPDGDISPTPTFESYDDNSTILVPDADRQFWLLTVLKSDGKSPPVTDLKNGLEKLYKIAFQRQQERHLGINSRIKRSVTNEKPVTVYIIKVSKSPINGDNKIEVLYHVSVSGQPVSATTAAADMNLVSDEEVTDELGYPFIIKAEPYLKVSDPEYLSSTNNTWVFIGVALSILFVLLLLVAFVTLAVNKRNRSPMGTSNKQQIFHQDVGVGHTNKAFDTNDNNIDKTREQSPTYINFRTQPSNETLRSGITMTRPKSTSSSSFSASSLDISPLMGLNKKDQRSPPRKLIFPRPKAALNKTAPVKPPRRNSLVFDSDSSCENSRRNSNDTVLIKNYDPGVVSPMSYLSMPSVKSFPRGNNPEPLNKVLEPVSVLHLDVDDDNCEQDFGRRLSGILTRHGSLSVVEDPGVIGPVVWSEHCKRLQRGVSMDQGIDSGKLINNVSRMRKRFHDLLDETFTLFGSRRESPVEDTRSVPFEVKSHSANANRPPDELQPELQLRPKTSDTKRPLQPSKPMRGAWATNAPSPLSRPVSAGPLSRRIQTPQIEVNRILTEGVLSPSDPAVPLIAAIKTELGKCSLPGSTTNLVG